MRLKARIESLERLLNDQKKSADSDYPPMPKPEDFLLPPGRYESGNFIVEANAWCDRVAYIAAADEWFLNVSGKTVHELAEQLAEEDGF